MVIAGGVESMSLVPMLVGAEDADPWLAEHRPEVYTTMGITAENVARQWGISRADMDAMAVESHRRAAQAQAGGCFDGQISSPSPSPAPTAARWWSAGTRASAPAPLRRRWPG